MLALAAGGRVRVSDRVMTTRGLPLCASSLMLALPLAAPAQNLERGKDINATCAGCHREFGQGGRKGEYPQLAGQGAVHVVDALQGSRKSRGPAGRRLAVRPARRHRPVTQRSRPLHRRFRHCAASLAAQSKGPHEQALGSAVAAGR